MNILFYQHQYPAFGGIETVTTMLANAFVKDGHSVAIVSFVHKDETNLIERLDRRVTWFELPEANIRSRHNFEALCTFLSNFVPDRIIFQDSYANIHQLLFSALSTWTKNSWNHLVVVEHSAPRFWMVRRNKPLSAVEIVKRVILLILLPVSFIRRFRYESQRRRELFDFAGAYVVLSKNYISRIRQLVGVRRLSKLHIIPNPTGNPRCAVNMHKKRKQMLFVGSLIAIKGVHRLLSAWKMLSISHPDWEFLIVGDGVERLRLEEMAAKMPRVRFEGFQRDPRSYYRDAAIFVMASDFEGWPMVLGESMQWGCVPVVYDSFNAASDIIDDGVNGRIVRHFHKKPFVHAVQELMDDADLRARMAKAAYEKSFQYSIDKVKEWWYKLLLGLDSDEQDDGRTRVNMFSKSRMKRLMQLQEIR